MKVLIFLGLICLAKSSLALSGRIINGQSAYETDAFTLRILSLEYDGQPTGRLGTGVAISEYYGLTIAQSLQGFEVWYIGYGSIHIADQTYQRVTETVIHPDFYEPTLSNNIGVIKLTESVGNSFVPIATSALQFPIMTTFGYGIVNEDTGAVATSLQQLVLMRNDYVCETEYQGINISSVICGAFPFGSGFGFGDQGGPITDTMRGELHGLVSYWGYEIDNPVVGVNISFYNEFITNAITLLS